MMLSFLARRGMSEREYSERVFGGRGIPSVASLQRSIEISWRNGFDVEGAAQLVWPPLCPCQSARIRRNPGQSTCVPPLRRFAPFRSAGSTYPITYI